MSPKHRLVKFDNGAEAVVRDYDHLHVFVQIDDVQATEATPLTEAEYADEVDKADKRNNHGRA